MAITDNIGGRVLDAAVVAAVAQKRGGSCFWCAYAAAVWMASALPPDSTDYSSARTSPTRSQLVRKSNDKLNSI